MNDTFTVNTLLLPDWRTMETCQYKAVSVKADDEDKNDAYKRVGKPFLRQVGYIIIVVSFINR